MSITTPKYVGGYFWWYYREDCVPYTNSLWTTVDNAMFSAFNISAASSLLGPNLFVSAYPNPFNPSTKIVYNIKNKSNVSLKVYDIVGKKVATLVSGVVEAGEHSIRFDGSNLSSGMYFVRVESEGEASVQKIVLVK